MYLPRNIGLCTDSLCGRAATQRTVINQSVCQSVNQRNVYSVLRVKVLDECEAVEDKRVYK